MRCEHNISGCDSCYAEASAGAYGTYVVRKRSRVEGSERTYADEVKSSTVVEVERHKGGSVGRKASIGKGGQTEERPQKDLDYIGTWGQ